ncbi:hypothetical protein SDJN03_17716, partial [Cucurbita argyrosperma subsp. sororia]
MTHFHLRLLLPILLLLLTPTTAATVASAAVRPRISLRKQVIFRPSSPSTTKPIDFEDQKRRVPTAISQSAINVRKPATFNAEIEYP